MLLDNPFNILGVSTQNNKQSTTSAADDKSLEIDYEICQKALSELMNPRTRLVHELSWLPGMSPKKANDILQKLASHDKAILKEVNIPELSRINILIAALEDNKIISNKLDFIGAIDKIMESYDRLNAQEIMGLINEDRTISGFPLIKTDEQISESILEIKNIVVNAIMNKLNHLKIKTLISIVTEIVDTSTNNGENQASEIIYGLVDKYSLSVHSHLEEELENIIKLMDIITRKAFDGESAVEDLIDKICEATRTWDMIAQPIQLSAKSRGLTHNLSEDIAFKIRDLGITLFNNNNMTNQLLKLNKLSKELFCELPEFYERATEDFELLKDILNEQEHSKEERLKEISFSAEIGLIFTEILSISDREIAWGDKIFPLESITQVAWGGTRHSMNGIPTGTVYTIKFGYTGNIVTVEIRKENIYSEFISKFWKAVCVRMLIEQLQAFQNGEDFILNGAVARDDCVVFTKSKLFGQKEIYKVDWGQVQTWSADGEFFIAIKEKPGIYGSLSYIHNYNTHILSELIGIFFQMPNISNLSDLLGGTHKRTDSKAVSAPAKNNVGTPKEDSPVGTQQKLSSQEKQEIVKNRIKQAKTILLKKYRTEQTMSIEKFNQINKSLENGDIVVCQECFFISQRSDKHSKTPLKCKQCNMPITY